MSSIIDPFGFVVLALAVFRLCRLFIEDQVFSFIREAVWRRFPSTHGFGYLFTCYWCMSVWFASLVTLSYMIVPTPTMIVALVLSVSAVVGFIAAWLDR